jgi:hypothetical protein
MKIAILLVAAALPGAVGEKPQRVSRPAVAAVEQNFFDRLDTADPAERFDILAFPQGVYLPGYGVVFTAKVNLIVTPAVTPFRQSISRKMVAQVRERKLKKVPLLKTTMKQFLVKAAESLDPVPSEEQVVVAVALHHYSWEDTKGLPQQIVFHAERQALLKRLAAADAAIEMEEY